MKALQILLSLFFVCLLGIGGVAVWAWTELTTPAEHAMANEIVNIPTGNTTDQTVQKLNEVGVIHNPLLFKLYIKASKSGSLIKAGDYQFPSPIAPTAVLKELGTGGLVPFKFTIIEGWTKWDVANAMVALKALKLKNSAQALAMLNDTTLIRSLDPKATSLEGYMFPDTYAVSSTTTAKDLVAATITRFREIWEKRLRDPAKERGLSAHEVVTIASLIETEAKLAQERPIVASVIYNRLRQKMSLSVDCTIIYASKLAGKWKNDGKVYLSDVNRDSPYNTRKVIGLPPGPVGCPGLASLEAALHPASSNYIYYVRNPDRNDGAHNFYADASGFERGVQALRNWEQRRDTKKPKHP